MQKDPSQLPEHYRGNPADRSAKKNKKLAILVNGLA